MMKMMVGVADEASELEKEANSRSHSVAALFAEPPQKRKRSNTSASDKVPSKEENETSTLLSGMPATYNTNRNSSIKIILSWNTTLTTH